MMQLDVIEEKLQYQFSDRGILLLSLTHKSYGNEFYANRSVAERDNERLEFLGDSILGVVVSDLLLEHFPTATEGVLSKMRAAVVNEKALAGVAKSLGLSPFIRLGKGEQQNAGQEKSSILASSFEALVAAVYLDGGFQAIKPFIRRIFVPLFQADAQSSFEDSKTELQEWVQSRWKISPSYHLVNTSGPDHAKIFEIEVRLGSRRLGMATGHSKKEAEQRAARVAIQNVR